MKKENFLIIDCGSQYTQLIETEMGKLGYSCLNVFPEKAENLAEEKFDGIFISGGELSVYAKNAPQPPMWIFESGVPILGICYGMQWMNYVLGGKVEPILGKKSYGQVKCNFTQSKLFEGCLGENTVWASHGDNVEKLAEGFSAITKSTKDYKAISGCFNPKLNCYGLQFHPEVLHTVNGKKILQNFANICKAKKQLKINIQAVIKDIKDSIRKEVSNKKVVIGFSGGVDSTTLAKIAREAIGNQLIAVAVDTGGLREGELDEIKDAARAVGVSLYIIDAGEEILRAIKGNLKIKVKRVFSRILKNKENNHKTFLEKLADAFKCIDGTTDAEEIREAFKSVYVKVFDEFAKKQRALYWLQGTLNTDEIESGKKGRSAMIKSHHNVGLKNDLIQLHPFNKLFKDDVRKIGKEIGLPEWIFNRHPFPGPGLYVRIVGEPITAELLEILRWATARATEILVENDEMKNFSQFAPYLSCAKVVGVKGDKRIYGYSFVMRAVVTENFMTAKGYYFSEKLLLEIASVVTKHPKIVRCAMDITSKPPATTEAM